jgi:hypothetical protein
LPPGTGAESEKKIEAMFATGMSVPHRVVVMVRGLSTRAAVPADDHDDA